jgi:predicted nucleic-acid-binding protein
MMFEFESIYKAYKECAKNKRNTLNAIQFEANLIENLINLETSLQNRTYEPRCSICFVAHSPKMREIFAADFTDRVVHHLLIDAIEPFYERKFIFDVYNNRKGKGIHSASKRAKKFANRFRYFLQLDIKGFFYHLDKNILFKYFYEDITKGAHKCSVRNDDVLFRCKDEILYLANRIIYHDPTKDAHIKGNPKIIEALPAHKTLFKLPKNRGLPIGNLTSQFFANVYLNRFDHFVKRELHVKAYLRYVDDFVLFSDSKEQLLQWKQQIIEFLHVRLKLQLRDSGILKEVSKGLDFLGYIIRPNYTLIRKRVIKNYKQKKAQYLDRYEALKGTMSLAEIKEFLSVQASFLAHAKHANSYNLINTVGVIHESNPFDFDT